VFNLDCIKLKRLAARFFARLKFRIMSRLRPVFFVFCAFVMTGCSGVQRFSNDHAQVAAPPDSVSAMLADAADRASSALETLAAVEQARTPAASVAPVGNAPTELRRAITVNWVGPVEPITKTLADRAGYSFVTAGSPPPVPLVVSIDVENKPVIDVLRDIGLQLGTHADVRVDSTQRVVEITYPPNAGVDAF
jgi:defect-in-organelle-trafficking protein DotD